MDHKQEALQHALQSGSTSNYGAIFAGFAEKGIDDIRPRENVFTFAAWQALGRQVKRGEHGVSVCTWIPITKKDDSGEAQPIGRKPRMTTVFHVSQTEPRAGYSEALWQYALRHGVVDPCAPIETREAFSTTFERQTAAQSYYSEQFEVTP